MVEFNGALYSYVHNLQGDVVGIVDNAGSLVVEYKYDAWGKPTLVRTLTTAYEALAELNPFRYRGYVYDEETGLYYLRSRYYDSERTRFINADDAEYVAEGMLINNLFSYCSNAPTIQLDSDGENGILIGLFGAVSAFAKAAASALTATVASIVASPVVTAAVVLAAGVAVVVTAVKIVTIVQRNHARQRTAEQVAEKSLAKSQEKIMEEKNRYDYWIAKLVRLGNGVETYIPTVAISLQRAIAIVRSGGNVFASSRGKAEIVASAAGMGRAPIRDPRHFNRATGSNLGYLRHYHEGYRRGGHVFYL